MKVSTLIIVKTTKYETNTISPDRFEVEAGKFANNVYDGQGDKIIRLTEGTNNIPFPSGKYTLDVGGKKVPIRLKEGKRLS